MLHIFVYEHLTGGGRFLEGTEPPSGSLLREGKAMFHSVCRDLSRMPDVRLSAMRDTRLSDWGVGRVDFEVVQDRPSHDSCFARLVARSRYVLVIAPETNGCLYEMTERAERLGGDLLSPDSRFVRLAADKLATAARLAEAGVPVPPTFHCRTPQDILALPEGPLIRKPIDGAGSWRVQHTDRAELSKSSEGLSAECVQVLVPGRSASVSVLCGGKAPVFLPPCWQRIDRSSFVYQGGETMTQPGHVARAGRLAKRTLDALPQTRGFIGVDLVLGDQDNGSRDFVIEVNPRLTTSYVGLQKLAVPNLGKAMWQLATGQQSHLTFRTGQVQFDAAGTVSLRSSPSSEIERV